MTEIVGIEYLNTSEVTSMYSMFAGCSSLSDLDLSHFDTSNVVDMIAMFDNCSSLKKLDVSHFDVKNVFSMNAMFNGCAALTSLDLSSFDISSVSDISYLFFGCTNLTTIYVSENWDMKNVKSSDELFCYCYKLVGGKGTKYDDNHIDISYARIDGGESAPGYFTASPSKYGDVNNDGQVNKSDINAIVDIIMEKTPSVPKESADVNNDGKVNAADIVFVVNETLNDQCLVISFKNGTKACYKLDNLVNTSFTTDALVVTIDKKSVSYPLSEVSQYTYEIIKDESDNTNFGNPTPITDSYEYFTINFIDGTKSQAFYTTDVDYISYSKTDMDGIEHANYQVQEIHTASEIIRYPLTQIDNLSFMKVNLDEVADDIASIIETLTPLFEEHSSTIELSDNLPIIKKIKGIEDAYTNNQTLFVKIHNWGYITFNYPIEDSPIEEKNEIVSLSRAFTNKARSIEPSFHQHVEAKKACIVNQQHYDENKSRKKFKEFALELCDDFRSLGISPNYEANPSLDFFSDEMFDYDILFIKTHGNYDSISNLHWICTSEEVWSYKPNVAKGIVKEKVKERLDNWMSKKYSPDEISIAGVDEIRGNELQKVFYVSISDKFIECSSKKKFSNAIVFNTACQSMMDNDNLAKAFEKRGAGCYLGYSDTNNIGGSAGTYFFLKLLDGMSIRFALNLLPVNLKEQKFYLDEDGKVHNQKPSNKKSIYCKPKLISYPQTSDLCIIYPETLPAEVLSEEGKIKIKGQIKTLNPYGDEEFSKTYYFLFSKKTDFTDGKTLDAKCDYDEQSHNLSIEYTFNEKELEHNTTYYYCASMSECYNNGFSENISHCFGDNMSFTTAGDDGGEPEAYTVLDGETLTFYYDAKKNERTGEISTPSVLTSLGERNYKWWMYNGQSDLFVNKVVKVVSFDPSFQQYTPQTTDYWFSLCTKLTTIENLKYLNTTNVTSMFNMFFGCNSLTDIDLSSFNTSNVTDMGQLFKGCRSLKNLNLSSFNTTNVTNMSSMFSGCSSLNSLDLSTSLDLSSFNTTKVPDMSTMFYGCSSLTSLDISSFNTTNVTNMSKMFSGCSSLTNLDLSGFNTKNVTDMSSMFSDCSSLTSLDMSGFSFANLTWIKRKDLFSGCSLLTTLNMSGCIFPDDISCLFIGCSLLTSLNLSKANTAAVTNMRAMFSGCSSLTSLDLSSFNTTNVTDMGGMFWGCSSLTSLDLSSFNTTNVTIMGELFRDCSSLTSLDLSSFNTANVTNMSSMFSGCSSLKILDMRGLTFPKDISSLFYGLSSLTNLNLRGANITNVTGTSYLFYGCSSLTDLDMSGVIFPKYVSSFFCRSLINLNLSGANFANATDMSSTFSGCSSLTNIDMSEVIFPDNISGLFSGKSLLTNLNLSGVNTTNVTNMSFMFSGCSSLTGLNLSSFNTANVTNMGAMFGGCSSLNNLNLSSFNTANVTNMGAMFSGCSSLNSLDLSGFNTTNVTDMGGMFYGCSSLKTIFANWKVHGYGSEMFFGCDELVGGKGTKIGDNLYGYDQYGNPLYYQCGTDSFAAHVDGGKDNPGLFTAK